MSVIITTTGATSQVVFNDLGGRTLNHPSSIDIFGEYFLNQIAFSNDLQNAINNGYVTMTINGVPSTSVQQVGIGPQGFQGPQGPQGFQGPQGPQGSISLTEVGSTSSFTTTSTSFVQITGMTATPTAGTYLALFNATYSSNTTAADIDLGIFVNGTINSFSERVYNYNGGANLNNARLSLSTQAQVTVSGTEAVDVRIRTNSGTVTVYQRNFILIKI